MANISSALNYALAGLSVSSAQSALVARNVSSTGDENYARRTAEIQTLPGGAPMVSAHARSTDRQLLDKLLLSTSDAAGKQAALDALNRMSALTGDPEDGDSLAAAFGKMQQSLRTYESNPANPALGRNALEAARTAASKLNAASEEVTRLRSEADRGMADAVDRINSLLAQFKVSNDAVVRGVGTPGDLAESLDQRDSILKQLSEELGIRTTVRPNNDILIHAEGGAVLFEGSPRRVSFAATDLLLPGMPANAVVIDGVAVTGETAPMKLTGGKIAAYATLRDRTAPQLSLQLDQMAAGLIRGFAESDQTVPGALPDAEGLFQGTGSLPSAANPPAGLAASIRLNPMADPGQGGSVLLIRDGGFGGPAYVQNAQGQPGYQKRIAALADSLDVSQAFGAAGEIGGTVSLKAFGTQSSAWVEAARQGASSALDLASATRTRASDSLARVTGVNIDQEMAALLDLEKSYQASSKVLSTVDAMLNALLEAVR